MIPTFLISYNNNQTIETGMHTIQLGSSSWLQYAGKLSTWKLNNQGTILYILGDAIIPSEFTPQHSPTKLIKEIKGNYYFFYHKKNSDTISIGASFLGLLPILISHQTFQFSSSIRLFNGYKNFRLDKQFVLESFLFNFTLSNRTLYDSVKRVPVHHTLRIKPKNYVLERFFNITELFVSKPLKGKNTRIDLVDCFLENSKKYFCTTKPAITFTSGFDGRTLVSSGLFFDKRFTTYSVGRREDSDVRIPEKNARELNLPYKHFNLNSADYSTNIFDQFGIEQTINTNCSNGFLHPHFLYGASQISQEHDSILSGLGGSELFRAAHIPGAITSKELFILFDDVPNGEKIRAILDSEKLRYLKAPDFKNELSNLKIDLENTINNQNKSLTRNQVFYEFIFENVFSKIFGPWVQAQSKYTSIYTPYLDFNFVSNLNQTVYAGTNNEYYTHNPFKRFNGQVIYAEIIRKTNKEISMQITGKGYRPIDLISNYKKVRIIYPYLIKRLKRLVNKEKEDIFCIYSSLTRNRAKYIESLRNIDFINSNAIQNDFDKMKEDMPEHMRDIILYCISISKYIDYE